MEKTVVTNVVTVTTNNVDEEEATQLAQDAGFDSIEEYAEHLEATVEEIVAHRLFGDADSIPILDVSTDVYDDFDEGEIGDVRVVKEDD